jgi:hypothetical protein
MPDTGGRYISVAVFCEKVLREGDGGLSLIRIFDRYSVPAPSPQTPPANIPLNVVVLLRSGMFRGPATLKIRPVSPSEQQLSTLEFPVNFEGDNERGAAIILNMGFAPPEQGLYWFDIILDDELITRIPLRVLFQRMGPVVGGPPTPPK